MNTRTIADLKPAELKGKRALVRVDFNVPLDDAGRVSDDTCIRAAVPTILALRKAGARVVLCSHLGRPKGKPDAKYTLAPVAPTLSAVASIDTLTPTGPTAGPTRDSGRATSRKRGPT